jgi:alpha-galactosidase
MLGRMYLSGHLDQMTGDQRRQVTHAVQIHRDLLPEIHGGLPTFPLGPPRWADGWTVT